MVSVSGTYHRDAPVCRAGTGKEFAEFVASGFMPDGSAVDRFDGWRSAGSKGTHAFVADELRRYGNLQFQSDSLCASAVKEHAVFVRMVLTAQTPRHEREKACGSAVRKTRSLSPFVSLVRSFVFFVVKNGPGVHGSRGIPLRPRHLGVERVQVVEHA